MAQPIERHLLRAKDFMDGRYAERLDIRTMAEAAGYSHAHFSREFRRAFGVSPREYLITRRLERAATLLRHTTASVAHICHAVGLTSVGSFTSTFTRTYGRSPTCYRQHAQGEELVSAPLCIVQLHTRPARVKE